MARMIDRVIREAQLNNNCPECFNQDLSLVFTQRHRFGRLYHRITGEVRRELKCNTCKNVIYPVRWTEDIERSVEYYEKAVQPEAPAIRFRPVFYVLLLIVAALAAAVVYAVREGLIPV